MSRINVYIWSVPEVATDPLLMKAPVFWVTPLKVKSILCMRTRRKEFVIIDSVTIVPTWCAENFTETPYLSVGHPDTLANTKDSGSMKWTAKVPREDS